MSTRATVIVKDSYEKIYFYRHSDGYPEGALPSLRKFMRWVIEGKIRNNAQQAAGWLVMIGARETDKIYIGDGKYSPKADLTEPSPDTSGYEWKVGNYEPSGPELPGDIEWLYELDVDKKTISFVPAIEGKTAAQLLKSAQKKVVTETEIMNPSVSDADFGDLYKAPEPEEGDACEICGGKCLELEDGPSGEEKVCCVCRDRVKEARCGTCLRSDDDDDDEEELGAEDWTDVQEWGFVGGRQGASITRTAEPLVEWGAVAKVGIKPRGKFKEWYQEEAWHDVLTALKENFGIDEKDIIYVKFVENTTRRFAYYLMVVFKKDGKYFAGPLFGKYSHAPNMKSVKPYGTVDEAMGEAGAQVEKKEQDRGYTPVTSFMREQYAAVKGNAGLIAGLAIMAAPFAYILLRRK